MIIKNIKDMIGGWYIGDFDPSAFKTKDFEVCYKKHEKGEKWDTHYHTKIVEINYLIKGKMIIQNTILKEGNIFILNPGEIASPTFLENCEIIIVKVPSIPNDKVIIKEKTIWAYIKSLLMKLNIL